MAEAMGSSQGRIEGLSGAQETALAALPAGGTFVKAAAEAGVSRVTVYRWVRDDPHFQAAYTAWQQEAAESARARLVKLADKAVDVVERALDRDDEKVALKVLRGVGALRKGRKASTRPEVLDLKIQLRNKRELRRAETAMLGHLMKKLGIPARDRKWALSGRRGTADFMEGLSRQLEGARIAEHPSGEGEGWKEANVTSPESGAGATDAAPRNPGGGNPLAEKEMQPTSGMQEPSPGNVTSDVTSEGMLHESVA
jgi:hypothetical protein